jgi:hydrogenase 3 maturation protease
MIIEAGAAPENVTGLLQRFQPDFVLFVDAAQMNEIPGAVGLWSYEQCDGNPVSTHTLPLSLVCAYLDSELDCEIAILGIQPAVLGYSDDLSPQIEKTLKATVPCLAAALSQVIGLPPHGSDTLPEFVEKTPLSRLSRKLAEGSWGRS